MQIARSVESQPDLSAEDRRQAASLQAGFAIRTADKLNEQGNQAAAYEALAPVLGRDPTNPAANLALARLYQGARQPDQAAQVAEAVLRGDPRSMDARMAAVDAAIAQRDWGRAEALLVEARAFNPNDPRVPLMEAKIARAGGNSGRALRALERAQDQLRGQGKVVPVSASIGSPGNPFRGWRPGGPPPRRSPASIRWPTRWRANWPRCGRRPRAASRAALGVRFRSGTAGLDRLSDVSAPISASLPARRDRRPAHRDGDAGDDLHRPARQRQPGHAAQLRHQHAGEQPVPADRQRPRPEPGDARPLHAARRHRLRRRARPGLYAQRLHRGYRHHAARLPRAEHHRRRRDRAVADRHPPAAA